MTPTAATADPLVGKRLSNCVLLKRIGQGGMGAVYVANHIGLNKHVAVKILATEMMGTDQNVQRFMREAQLAASLEHPNVVAVYDVGQLDAIHYLVMQYIEGPSLDKLLESGGALDSGDMVAVMKQVAAALGAAHKHGIVHRDVKPGNIMLTRVGVAKVADFGLARSMDSGTSLSGTGQIVGTPHYMAPEQAQGQVADRRADIYALGASFYHLVVGTPPFVAETPIGVVLKHIQVEAVPAYQARPDVPVEVSDVIVRMMMKDPAARPESCDEVLALLNALAVPLLHESEPASLSHRLAKAMAEMPPVSELPTAPATVRITPPPAVREAAASDLGGLTMLDLGVGGATPPQPPAPKKTERTSVREFVSPPPPTFAMREITSVRTQLSRSTEMDLPLAESVHRLGFSSKEQIDAAMAEQGELRKKGEVVALGHLLLRLKTLTLPQYIQVRSDLEMASANAAIGAAKDIDFGHYRLLHPIGEDAEAVVWEAEDKSRGRPVALRFLKSTEADLAKRLYQEAAQGRELQHPNIVTVHEAGTEVDHGGKLAHYIAVERIHGCTLADVILGRALPVARLLELFHKIATAVHYAHGKGVIHGNLRPSDVIVDGQERPVLVYFGRPESSVPPTMASAPYLAPEQGAARTRSLDAAIDIYHLGVLLYEALAGRPAFRGATISEIQRRVSDREPEALRMLNPDVGSGLASTVKKAMEKDPAKRFATAADFATALREKRREESSVVVSKAMKTATSTAPRRARAGPGFGFGALIGLVILALVGIAGVGYWILGRGGSKDPFDMRVAEARELFDRGDFAGAMAAADQAIVIRPDPSMRVLVAQSRRRIAEPQIRASLEALGKAPAREVAAAAERLESALLQLDPIRNEPGIVNDRTFAEFAGMASAAVSQYERTELYLQRAVDLGTEDSAVLLALAWARVERWMLARKFIDIATDEGECRLRVVEGLRKALEVLQRRTKPERTGIDLARAAALAAMAQGDSTATKQFARRGREQYGTTPGTEDFEILLAVVSDADTRLRACGEVTARVPSRAIAYAIRAAEFLDEGKLDEALEDLEWAAKAAPGNALVYAIRGRTWERRGDFAKAIEDYTRALRNDVKFVDVLLRRALLRTSSNDAVGARADFDAAIAINMSHPMSYVWRGHARKLKGDLAGAEQDYRSAMEAKPEAAAPHLYLGMLWLQRRDASKAIAAFTDAIQRDVLNVEAYAGRGEAYLRKAENEAGAADLQKALDLGGPAWDQRERILKMLAEIKK